MPGLYLHIPYCKQACSYCDFHFSTTLRSKTRFVDALIQEMEMRNDFFGSENQLDTVYFGGGTPSLLSAEEFQRIFAAVKQNFNVKENAEITLEANPDDLTGEKVSELAASPINRLSVGVQSFFDEDLKLMNRAHNAAHAHAAIRQIKAAGFENITIDLIYGTPSLSDGNWRQNLQMVLDYGISHISAYCLTVEEQTPLEAYIKKGKVKDIDEAQSIRQFEILMEKTREHSYEHYEISNFAKPGFRSRHNSSYWHGEKYLGLGPSAHSYNGEERLWNISNNYRYFDAIESGKIPAEKENLTIAQRYNEAVLTQLRLMEGIDLHELEVAYGSEKKEHLLSQARPYIKAEKLIQRNGSLQLTDEGKLIADRISLDLFMDE